MLSPETGSSFCLKQTLGAPDATESYALSLGHCPSAAEQRSAETPPSLTVCQQRPFPWVRGSVWPERGSSG